MGKFVCSNNKERERETEREWRGDFVFLSILLLEFQNEEMTSTP